MQEIYSFLLAFYNAYNTNNSTNLKKLYFNTFETEIRLDDTECDEADNSCLFDELYDEFVDRIKWLVQNIWWILYCDIDWWFLITYDKESDQYLINGEVLEKNINEATCYFYDLFWQADGD